MKIATVLSTLVLVLILSGCGSGSNDTSAAAAANTATPKPKVRDATAADNAKALANNPNLSPEVKKILGGAGH